MITMITDTCWHIDLHAPDCDAITGLDHVQLAADEAILLRTLTILKV